jgi:ParB family transcriptional regulator, chromosome partitioning protein
MGMNDDLSKSRLGRGLAALLGDVSDDEEAVIERAKGQRLVPVSFLRSSAFNPRKHFADDELAELAASLKERGVLQPILVRSVVGEADAFEIVAGERRWRAAQLAGLESVPVILMEVDDRAALEIAVIENIQRSDLNPLEEAMGYAQLIEAFGYAQTELSKVLGKSRSHINSTLRLLKLPVSVRQSIADGKLTAGHARALLVAADPEAAAERIIAGGFSVRETEQMIDEDVARGEAPALGRRKVRVAAKDDDTRVLEETLSTLLGLDVSIKHGQDGGGAVTIRYRNLEQLEALCKKLKDKATARTGPSIRLV